MHIVEIIHNFFPIFNSPFLNLSYLTSYAFVNSQLSNINLIYNKLSYIKLRFEGLLIIILLRNGGDFYYETHTFENRRIA